MLCLLGNFSFCLTPALKSILAQVLQRTLCARSAQDPAQCSGKSICLGSWAALGTGRVQTGRDLEKERLLGAEKTSLGRSSCLQPLLDLTRTWIIYYHYLVASVSKCILPKIGKWWFINFRQQNIHHPYFSAAYGKSWMLYINGFTYCLHFIHIILLVLKYKNIIINILDVFYL